MEINWDELKCDAARLVRNEPVQYVTGISWFYGLKLNVTKDVLIPRPETEELLQKISKIPLKKTKILDIGTGSGCIAISVKKLFPEAEVFASDNSETALKIAKHNAEKNDTEIIFINDDILKSKIQMNFDIIVSNPPYVTEKEKSQMDKNVLEYEPHNALFVPDTDALKFYTAITQFANKKLNSSGYLFFEINEVYNDEVCDLLGNYSFINIESFKDINNKWRIVKAQKA